MTTKKGCKVVYDKNNKKTEYQTITKKFATKSTQHKYNVEDSTTIFMLSSIILLFQCKSTP